MATLYETTVGHKIHTNVSKWTPAANAYKENKRYTNQTKGTSVYKAFWKEERKRCLYGYRVDDDWISGYHYFYLNYCPIMKVIPIRDKKGRVQIGKEGKIVADRVLGFPDFIDGDYDYFHYLEFAENGDVNRLKLFPEVEVADEDLNTGGFHAGVLKCRGRGYSFKGASMVNRNYFLIEKSTSFIFAAEKGFLLEDGICEKAWEMMNFIDDNTAWNGARMKHDKPLYKKMSYIDKFGNEKGRGGKVIGKTLKNDPQKARGIRGKLILWEEAGKFPGLTTGWTIARKSVEQGDRVFGLMVWFGTGGDEGANFEGAEEMFYTPEAYNILSCKNTWSENAGELDTCAYFVPAYVNYEGATDENGNSLIEAAKIKLQTEREKVKKAKDAAQFLRECAEAPITPEEATLRLSNSFFNYPELRQWEQYLMAHPTLASIGNKGYVFRSPSTGKLEFKHNKDAMPVTWPEEKGKNREGCVVLYFPPHKDKDGIVPDNLYYACADPYGLNTEGGESLGVIWIMSTQNNITTHPDDTIVAEYIGRPKDQDDWNKTAFDLAELYNAKITMENDRGNMIEYAKNNKRLKQLEPEFGIMSNTGKEKNNLSRGFGVSMSDRDTKLQAIQYEKDWVMRKRGVDANGNDRYTFHYIYSLSLIRQYRKYSLKGNFDLVSAKLVGQFIRKKNINVTINVNKHNKLDEFKKIKWFG